MNRPRPVAVLVMAILNLIFGAIGVVSALCVGLFALLFTAVIKNAPPPPGGGPNPIKELEEMFDAIPGYIPIMTTVMVLGAIAAIVLIIAGIGLLKMKTWARWLSVGYAIYNIVATLAMTIYTIAVVNPAMETWQRNFQQKFPAGAPQPTGNAAMNNVISVGSAVVGIAYAVALLVVMFLPHVRAAFAGTWRPPITEDDDQYDETEEDSDYDHRRDPNERFRRAEDD
jgi:hypothetical protein